MWSKYWSFNFSISPSNEYSRLIFSRIYWLDLLAIQGTLKSLLPHHSSKASILWHLVFFIVQLSHPYMTTGKTIGYPQWIIVWPKFQQDCNLNPNCLLPEHILLTVELSLYRTIQLQLLWVSGWGIDLDYCDTEWFALDMKRDHSVTFETAPEYCIWDSFVDYEGYSFSSKGFLPAVVDVMVIWIKFSHSSSF